MNVEVLGDDVCYGSTMATMYEAMMARVKNTAPGQPVQRIPGSILNRGISPNSISNKQLRFASQQWMRSLQQRRASNQRPVSSTVRYIPPVVSYNGSYLGGDAWDSIAGFFTKAVEVVGKGFSSSTGKAMVSAGLTNVAGRITPTDKAKIATAQEAAGITPQVFTGGGATFVKFPGEESSMTSILPIAVGGVALMALMIMMFKMSK